MSLSPSLLTRDFFFQFAPLESLHLEDIKDITTIEELKKAKLDDHLLQYAIGEYKAAIITDTLFSFFRFTDKQAYLIIIDKRSNSKSEVKRHNFYGLLDAYGKGKIVVSSAVISSEQRNKSINLTNVLVKGGEAFVLELLHLHEDYAASDDWWMRDVIYEIILASYQDSNNDGIGDIQGLRQRLDYLQSLGIKAIWLTPIYPSPWKDYGYDISNFCDIDPRFGTLDDFRALINDLHSRQMRLILDFVPNHTSNEHPWFQAALRNDPNYVDYYIWHPGKNNGKDLPTNWLGIFSQPMWTFSSERNMYYLHQFVPGQPDLNLCNEKVLQELEKILCFWLDLGVDGFRVDATCHLVEDDEFQDEPLRDPSEEPQMYGDYKHTETANQPETYQLIRRWRKFLDQYAYENHRDYLLFITEVYNKDIQKIMRYFGENREERGTDIVINFLLVHYRENKEDKQNGLELDKRISKWQLKLPNYARSSWCLGSHDNRRIASHLPSEELIDGFYMLLLLQSGTALVYYGDEIAMCDRPFTLANREEIVDQTVFNYQEKYIEEKVRDCQRTPMQWTSEKPYAGFTSEKAKPFLPLSETYHHLNVQQQQNATRSHLKLFHQLVQLREQSPFYGGHQKKVSATKEYYAFIRWLDRNIYLVVISLTTKGSPPVTIHFDQLLQCEKKDFFGEVIVTSTNVLDHSPIGKEGNQVSLNDFVLQPSEAVVFKLTISPHEIPLCQ